MIDPALSFVRDRIAQRFAAEEAAENTDSITLTLVPDYLSVIITKNDITVAYQNESEGFRESDEFIRCTYKNDHQWVDAACDHVALLATQTIMADCACAKSNDALLSYKVWAVGERNRRLLKTVCCRGLIARLKPAYRISKMIHERGERT